MTPQDWTTYDVDDVAAGLQEFLICVEMFFAALAHAQARRHAPGPFTQVYWLLSVQGYCVSNAQQGSLVCPKGPIRACPGSHYSTHLLVTSPSLRNSAWRCASASGGLHARAEACLCC